MEQISYEQLKTMNEEQHRDFVLINVLSPEQFNQQHIRTSVNIPLGDDNFVEKVNEVAGSKDREVVVYCASFDCDASEKAAEKLESEGFSRVYDYAGGTRDWFNHKAAA